MSKLEAMTDVTIGWEKGDKYAEANLPAGHRLNNRLKKLYKKYPDDFQRFVLNNDGTLYVKIPVNWIQIRRPKEGRLSTMTEEQIQERIKLMNEARQSQRIAEEKQ